MSSAKVKLDKIIDYLNENSNRQIKNDFLEKYSICEVYCRQYLKKYLVEIGEYYDDEDMGMELQTIKDALSDAGVVFEDKKLLTRLWGKSQKKGERSCRFLRNKITHELMLSAINEIVERNEDINRDMDEFIRVVSENR